MTSERIIYDDMVGHVFAEIHVIVDGDKDDRMIFVREDGVRIAFLHFEDCCEFVCIEDVNGECQNLIGKPLRVAEMYTTDVPQNECRNDDDMYTFYRFATEDEFVTVRWHGSSNGYYSVEVDKVEMRNNKTYMYGMDCCYIKDWVFYA